MFTTKTRGEMAVGTRIGLAKHTASIARAAWQSGGTNRHANEINPSVCKQDWWGAAVGSRLARALPAEQVTTLIVCSYSFDIDEEGAAHNGSSATLTILLSVASCRCYCSRVGSQGSCPRQGLLACSRRACAPPPSIQSHRQMSFVINGIRLQFTSMFDLCSLSSTKMSFLAQCTVSTQNTGIVAIQD